MLLFSWTFTPNQVACLKCVRDYEVAEEAGGDPLLFGGLSNWMSGTRFLIREGLVYHTQVPNDLPKRFVGKTRDKWGTTEKGRLFLRILELEVEDQRKLFTEGVPGLDVSSVIKVDRAKAAAERAAREAAGVRRGRRKKELAPA